MLAFLSYIFHKKPTLQQQQIFLNALHSHSWLDTVTFDQTILLFVTCFIKRGQITPRTQTSLKVYCCIKYDTPGKSGGRCYRGCEGRVCLKLLRGKRCSMCYKLRVIELMVLNILGVLQKAERFCIRCGVCMRIVCGPRSLKVATNTVALTKCRLHLQQRYKVSYMNYCWLSLWRNILQVMPSWTLVFPSLKSYLKSSYRVRHRTLHWSLYRIKTRCWRYTTLQNKCVTPTLWGWVLLQKQIVPQVAKTFLAFYGTERSIIFDISQSWITWIQSTTAHPTPVRSTLTVYVTLVTHAFAILSIS